MEATKKKDVFVLCENLKAIRKSKGLSQQALAVKLNVVRQTVSKWEQGGSLKLMSCGMISIDGKLFMNRVEKMKHIAIIVLCGKFIFFAHTNAFRHLDRSKVIRFYD